MELITRAFFDYPLCIALFPDETSRWKNLKYMWSILIRQDLELGKIYGTSENLEGIAGWLTYDNVELTLWKSIRFGGLSLLFHAGYQTLKKIMAHNNLLIQLHKRNADFPHYYLDTVAVDPKYRGKGYASKLLRPMLDKIDNANVPCYLCTGSEKNLPIYEHFSFEVVEKVFSPVTEVFICCMLRKKIEDR
jgi:ribosomal protein S18 acetylase RimI-like enzyme